MEDFITINTFAYVLSNILIAYIAGAVVVFVILYYIWFDPRATTAGKFIFRFFLSLVGIIGLVFVGVFVDPAGNRSWTSLPPDVEFWRPILRLIVYGYVAFTITSLAVILVLRKWRPNSLKTSQDKDLVVPRHPTTEVPVIQHPVD